MALCAVTQWTPAIGFTPVWEHNSQGLLKDFQQPFFFCFVVVAFFFIFKQFICN